MAGSSPKGGLPVTPTLTRPRLVASSTRPRAICLYRKPTVKDVDEDEVPKGHALFGLSELGAITIKALKVAAATYYSAVDSALDAHQEGLNAHLAKLHWVPAASEASFCEPAVLDRPRPAYAYRPQSCSS
ncbi:hypothetical protein VE02_10370 [Pseudogymnoascus sp. 03VT05]|nr:hypothetical protein VE02_10370 [Pseudogymnoascus sp. 03VT05]